VKTGFWEKLTPQPVTYAQAYSGLFSDNLISMSGKLVSQLQGTGSETLVIDVDGHLVSATLEGNEHFATYLQGSRVQVTGICRIVAGGPFRTPALFRIEMRSGADVQLLAEPSWWTVRHLLELLAVFLVAAILIAGWALLLRQRLVVQTNRIQRSMAIARERSRILEKINCCHAPEELFAAICDTVTSLLPGVECSYLFEEKSSERSGKSIRPLDPAKQLYKMDLYGSEGGVLGWILVSELDSYVPSEDRHEVFDMLSEISKLAVNQLLLHRALVHHSTHDALTELPNRRLCDRRFEDALEEARINGSKVAVIYIDVDRFKEVNDQHGHRIGDLYLQQISARLLAAKRQSDTLARIGGDEFLLIMPSDSSYENAETVLSRLEKCFDHPFSIEGRLVLGSASLGFARYPDHGQTTEELKLHADHQMYASKRKRNASVLMVESRSA
jgi:diguanylate cyclase (GGDEF)-like protein